MAAMPTAVIEISPRTSVLPGLENRDLDWGEMGSVSECLVIALETDARMHAGSCGGV